VTHIEEKPMKILLVIIIIVIFVMPVAIAELLEPKRAHTIEYPDGQKITEEMQRQHTDIFDWQNSTPLDFLKYLESHRKPIPIYTVVGVHKNWIKAEDIPALIKLFDAKQPCAHVVSVLSSYLPPKSSTVGNEAAYLVDGFFKGQYPPGLYSHKIDKKKLIRQWEDPCDFSCYHPIRISYLVKRNGKIFQPEYPEEARKKKVEGTVIVKILINRDGIVEKACVISGDPLLRKASEDAALKSTFEPVLLNNKKIPYIEEMITFKYVLSKNSEYKSKVIGTEKASITLDVKHC
jgi:TonB family protein